MVQTTFTSWLCVLFIAIAPGQDFSITGCRKVIFFFIKKIHTEFQCHAMGALCYQELDSFIAL